MIGRIGAVALVALALAWPAAAAGQDPLEPPDVSRFLHWGPVRARPTFVVTNLGHEDNVFYRTAGDLAGCDDNDPATPCRPALGDYTITVSPRLDGLVLFGHTAFLTFTERLDYTAYRKYSSLNFFNQYGKTRLTLPLGWFGFYVEGAFNRTKDRPADFQDIRNQKTEARLGGGVIVKLGWRTDAEAGLYRTRWRNRDPDSNPNIGFSIADRLDRVETGGHVKLRYLALGRTRITLEASSQDVTFNNPAVRRDARQRRLLPGVEFGEGGRLTGSLRVGPARFEPVDPARPDFSGTVGDAELYYRFRARTTLRAEGHRDVYFALYQDNLYFVDTGYELHAVHYLNRLFGVEAGGSRRTLDFSETQRSDLLFLYEAGIRLRLAQNSLGKRVEYSLKFGRLRRNSNLDVYDQTHTVFGFGAVVGF